MIWDRLDWELALITTTLCSITNGEGLKVLLYPSIKHWNNPGDISLPWTGECHQIPPPSLRAASASKKKKKKNPTTIDLRSANTLHTLNYDTSLAVGLSWSSQTPGVTKGNLGLTSLSHSTWWTPETKR